MPKKLVVQQTHLNILFHFSGYQHDV